MLTTRKVNEAATFEASNFAGRLQELQTWQQQQLGECRTFLGGALTARPTISPDVLYRSDELKNRLGWHDAAWRRAVREGLTICKQGRWHYVLGSDVIRFFYDEGGSNG